MAITLSKDALNTEAASRKAYAPGPNTLAHFANDAGQRAALVLQYKER